jgi:hypothetical protein
VIVPITKYRFSKVSLAPRRTCFNLQIALRIDKINPVLRLIALALLRIELEFHYSRFYERACTSCKLRPERCAI